MPTVVEDNLLRRDSSRSGISLSEERAEKRSPSLIGMTVGSLQVTCSRLGISLRRPVVFNNGMGLLRRGGPHNGTSTYTASRSGGVPPISGQPQQNSQSGPLEQPQATTPHEERARTDEMGLANLALRIKYRGERTRMIPMDRKRPVDAHIGQRLKEYRQLRGMTVRELADAADVTPGQISHYEHGRDRISHERITEFARILRIKPNDLYQPPGSRLRRNHVRWRLTNFMAAVIAEAAALMSSWRKAAADNEATINEATMVAAVAVAVASAAAASDAGAGNHATKTAWHVSDDGRGGKIAHDSPVSATGKDTSAQSTSASANGDHSASPFKPTVDHHAIVDPGIKLDLIPTDHLLQHPADNLTQPDHGADPAHPYVDGNQSASADDSNAHPGKVPHDPPARTARSSDLSGDDSARPFKTNLDHHAVDDPETNSPSNSNNHPLQQPAHNSLHTPAQHHALHTPAQHHDHGSPAVTDGAHLGSGQVDGIESASPKLADDGSTNSGNASADPDINDQHPADNSLHTLAQPDDGPHPADPPVDVTQLPNFKFANNDSAHPGTVVPHDSPTLTTLPSDSSGTHGPAAPNLNVPGTVMSDAASDQFVFEKGHDKVANVKPDMIETDHAVAEIRHLLDTAHDANAVGALDPNHTTAPHDMTKVQLPYHHGDFHFA